MPTVRSKVGAVHVHKSDFLQAEDLVYECLHLTRLVFNAIESMELDSDMRALSAGVYVIENKLSSAGELFEYAKRVKDSVTQ
ncbi:hypothetical protein B5M44_26020 [Shinella sumterensis]|jgi:hypothetical protein|nr:hypothetical protein B5M44_26020 [Shinella sumterensis]